jgi:beta-lactamase class A
MTLARSFTTSLLLITSVAAAPVRAADPSATLRAEIESLVAASGAEVAVAVKSLDGQVELLIRPDEEFHAASTMKVAVMVELFRQAAADNLLLDDAIPVVNEFRSIVDGSPFSLSVGDDSDRDIYDRIGSQMTYRELCEVMITISSNLATNLLIDRLGADRVQATTDGLGATGMKVRRGVEDGKAFAAGLNNTTTARGLLVLLEAIAAGRAGSPEASREMIEILARQRFNDAIPAGLPEGLRVAHKTGSITRIHHDAGIVYGEKPYVLVVLTRGIDQNERSAALIAEVARVVHAAIE